MSRHRHLPSNPADPKMATLRKLRRLSHVLDNAIAIPGTSWRIGLDPIIGLIPGAGDYLGAAFSAYIVVQAAKIGVPRELLGQMVLNIALETILGSVPMVGDVVDAAWKANAKNIELVEDHLGSPAPAQKADWLFLGLILTGLVLVVVAMSAVTVIILRFLWQLVQGS